MISFIKNKKGSTLLLVVLILAVVFAIAIGITEIILVQLKISGRVEDSVLAFYAADSGMECQLYQIRYVSTTSTGSVCAMKFPNNAQVFAPTFSVSTSTGSYIDSLGQGPLLSRRGILVTW